MTRVLASMLLVLCFGAPPTRASLQPQVTITLVRWPFVCSLSDPADLIIRDVAAEIGDRVKVVVDEYGQSELARRSGVKRFPVVFVGDELFARPEDFGFEDSTDGKRGRYVPWREPANQRRFREELKALLLKKLARDLGSHNSASWIPRRRRSVRVSTTSGAAPKHAPPTAPRKRSTPAARTWPCTRSKAAGFATPRSVSCASTTQSELRRHSVRHGSG